MADLHLVNQLQAFTNIPRDRYVNTFNLEWIGAPPVPDIDSAAVVGALATLEGFYDTIAPALSPVVTANATAFAYRWQDPKPRVPLVRNYTLPARGAAGQVEECAFVLGYRGAPPHTRDRRGRIYIGPLVSAGITTGSSSAFSAVNGTVHNTVRAAAQTLGDTWFTNNWLWVISNRLGSTAVPIAEFTYDTSPDTQRRRGYEPNARFIEAVSWA